VLDEQLKNSQEQAQIAECGVGVRVSVRTANREVIETIKIIFTKTGALGSAG
jgi:hypothetical protein